MLRIARSVPHALDPFTARSSSFHMSPTSLAWGVFTLISVIFFDENVYHNFFANCLDHSNITIVLQMIHIMIGRKLAMWSANGPTKRTAWCDSSFLQ